MIDTNPHIEVLNLVQPDLLLKEGYKRHVAAADCAIVAHIHILPSTISLLSKLVEMGFRPSSIVLVPKPYSTIPSALKEAEEMGCKIIRFSNRRPIPGKYDSHSSRLLESACSFAFSLTEDKDILRFILVDDGGFLTSIWHQHQSPKTQYDVISVQQTASGFYPYRLWPKVRRIDVARCAAKKNFEARIIVDGAMRKVLSLHILKKIKKVGVVGIGALGQKLSDRLSARKDMEVFTYDRGPYTYHKDSNVCDSWLECVQQSELIFGCTGHNFMHQKLNILKRINDNKARHLISLSSRDVEFQTLLLESKENIIRSQYSMFKINPFSSSAYYIYNGGFPINFDRQQEWETSAEISLTRALVLIGVLQALHVPFNHDPTIVEKLALLAQKQLVKKWLLCRGVKSKEYSVSEEQFDNTLWWHLNSGGDRYLGSFNSGARVN